MNTWRLHVIAAFAVLIYLYSLVTIITPFSIIRPYPTDPEYYAAFVAFVILWSAYYIGNKYFDYAEDQISQPEAARHSKGLLIGTILMYVVPLTLLIAFQLPLLPYLLLQVMTILYSLPIRGVKAKSILGVKTLYAAGSWWVTAAVFVAYYAGGGIDLRESLIHTYDLFVIMISFELLWDIRDIRGDSAVGTITVPVYFGVVFTQCIIVLNLLVGWWQSNFTFGSMFTLNLAFLALAGLLVKKDYPPQYYHTLVLIQIGILLTQLLLIYA